jgi:hypothetical protein
MVMSVISVEPCDRAHASPAPPGLFASVLGPAFENLPDRVRWLHRGASLQARGVACVRGDSHWRARVLRAIACLPGPTDSIPLAFEIHAQATGESWLRRFGDRPMHSRLDRSTRFARALEEQLGPVRLSFAFELLDHRLHWILRELRVLGVALPLRWFRGMRASCGEQQGRYVFDIDVRLPLVGRLVAYSGWLEPLDDEG